VTGSVSSFQVTKITSVIIRADLDFTTLLLSQLKRHQAQNIFLDTVKQQNEYFFTPTIHSAIDGTSRSTIGLTRLSELGDRWQTRPRFSYARTVELMVDAGADT
jgi:hypothetical protein